MESVKEKLPIILVTFLAIVILGGIIYYLEYYEATYYTRIDNAKLEQVSSTDDMKYQYTLTCYNENGKKKELTFKASRELRQDAYLLLEVRCIGVHTWKEVQEDELPDKVKVNY